MLKQTLLLLILITTSLFSYEIVIHQDLSQQERKEIKNLLNPGLENLILIKAGSFEMGSSSGDADEKPVHRVHIDYDFYIGEYEVTVGEFRAFVESTSYTTDAEKNNGCKVYDDGWKTKKDASWENPYFKQSEKNPVVCVSHNDAKAYTTWLSKQTNKRFRLPTESEWEYVARAGTSTKYSFGDSIKNLGNYAWYLSNSSSNRLGSVGKKRPNPWGLYDMHGNVREWCEDWYVNNYKKTPRNGDYNNNGSQNYKILRGGAWSYKADNLRSADRGWNTSTYTSNYIGFRVVRLP